MIAFGFGLERVMLRKLIGRPVIAVIMATIGLAAILRGWGRPPSGGPGTSALPLPIRDEPVHPGPALHPAHPAAGRRGEPGVPGRLRLVLPQVRKGIAMRAVADNQQVAMAMGINVERYFGAGLGDDRHRLGAGRRHLGQPAGRRRAPAPWSASRCSRW